VTDTASKTPKEDPVQLPVSLKDELVPLVRLDAGDEERTGNGQLRCHDQKDEPLNVLQVAVFDDLEAPFIEAKPLASSLW
jgi:hypothetical protein